VAILLDLVRDLSMADDPASVLKSFSHGMVRLNGPAGFISLSCRGLNPGEYRITRLLPDDNIADIHKGDPWSNFDHLAVHSQGFLGRLVRQGRPQLITDLELPDDPVLGRALANYHSLLAAPIYEMGQPLNWGIILRHDAQAFTQKDLEDQLLRANLVGGTVRHVQTAQRLRQAHANLDREVQRVASIQRALLPEQLPAIPHLTMAASYETFDQAGGDLYLFHPMTDGRWAIFVGDASGHGLSAAVVMAMVHAMNYAYAQVDGGSVGFFEFLNRQLCAKQIDGSFVTAIAAVFDPSTLQLDYTCAGHPPPILRRPAGEGRPADIHPLPLVGNMPLGILPDLHYPVGCVQLQRGDSLVLYTDGITEARNAAGDFFGEAGIIATLNECTGAAACVVDTLKERVHHFQAGRRPQDDQTLLVLQVV
jgi:sigma-B regulation protein RsbU (phosphoserine phosphatase)